MEKHFFFHEGKGFSPDERTGKMKERKDEPL